MHRQLDVLPDPRLRHHDRQELQALANRSKPIAVLLDRLAARLRSEEECSQRRHPDARHELGAARELHPPPQRAEPGEDDDGQDAQDVGVRARKAPTRQDSDKDGLRARQTKWKRIRANISTDIRRGKERGVRGDTEEGPRDLGRLHDWEAEKAPHPRRTRKEEAGSAVEQHARQDWQEKGLESTNA